MLKDIVLLYTVQGQMIGELVEKSGQLDSFSDRRDNPGVCLKNPCLLQMTDKGVQFMPLLALVPGKDHEATIPKDKLLFQETFPPVTELLNQYSRIFGAGIQLATTL